MKTKNLEEKAKEAIIQSFQGISFLEIKNIELTENPGDMRPDFFLELKDREKSYSVIAELKNNGEPRYARQATIQIRQLLDVYQGEYGLFIAPYISDNAAAICREAGVGYIDLAGNCHISFGNIYIHREGISNPFTRKSYLKSLFSPKAERVLRVLLTAGPREWKVEELAYEADVSLGQVSNVKKLLDEQEWIESKSIGFSITNPSDLLEEWSNNYTYRRNEVLEFYAIQGIAEFEYQLGEISKREKIRYGLTGFSGSARFAPAVRYQRAMAYVQEYSERVADALEIKAVDSGANVLVFKPYDDGVFYGSQDRDGSIVVSPIQIYLDLVSFRGRGEEAAQILLDKVIRETW